MNSKSLKILFIKFMFTDFENLHDLLNNGIARVANNKLNNLLKNYSFIRISEKIIFDENHCIYH